MVEIYKNESLKLIQDKNNNTMYKIVFSYPCHSIVRSLIKTRLIEVGTLTDDYLTLRFKAITVKPYKKFIEDISKVSGSFKLNINLSSNMINDLTIQLSYLITKESVTIIGYSIEDIIVINDKTFVFLGSDLLIDIDDYDKKNAIISAPFDVKKIFVSPELLRIKELPSYVHYKTSFFSLGCLLLYVLTSSDIFYNEYLKELKCVKIHERLNQLHFKNTKLYWLLSRCLVEEPELRSILFI